MSKVQEYQEHFENKDFRKESFPKGEYECCRFSHCQLSEEDLSGCVFIDCEFESCDLSTCKLDNTAFREVRFTDCKMLGLRFDDCNTFLLELYFHDCNINMSSFFQLNVKAFQFQNCSMQDVDMAEVEAEKVAFPDCDLSRAIFERSHLEGADFRTSIGLQMDPDANRIKGAKFSRECALGLLHKYQIVIEA